MADPIPQGPDESGARRRWVFVVLIALVLLAGGAGFATLMLTRSRLGRRPRPAVAPLVKIVTARSASVPVVVRSMGGVKAAREVRLVPQVAGRVVQISPRLMPSGRVKRGEVLVRIDPADYKLAVREARAAVTQARLALDVQLGHRAVARTELKLLAGKVAPSKQGRGLATRESYVDNARAQLDAARSRLEQALLARKRTVLRAPFDARVSEKHVDVGQVVSTQSVLATLVASDEVWVEATLPVDQLRWIDLPGPGRKTGAPVIVRQKLTSTLKTARQGEVLGLVPGLLEQGKLARLLVRIRDPFGPATLGDATPRSSEGQAAAALPLLVGSFVHLEIQGRTLPGLFALPRGALRGGNRVWVCEAGGKLAFRAVELIWSRDETVYVRGALKDGDRVVTSRLTAPLPGMKVAPVEDRRPLATRQGDQGDSAPPPARDGRISAR